MFFYWPADCASSQSRQRLLPVFQPRSKRMASDSCGVSQAWNTLWLSNWLRRRRTGDLGRLAVLLGLLSCANQLAHAGLWPSMPRASDERSIVPAPLNQDATTSSDSTSSPAATSSAAIAVPESTANPFPLSPSRQGPSSQAPGGWRNLIIGAVCAAALALLGVGTLVLSMRRSILHPIEDPVPMKPRE